MALHTLKRCTRAPAVSSYLEEGLLIEARALVKCDCLLAGDATISVLVSHSEPSIEEIRGLNRHRTVYLIAEGHPAFETCTLSMVRRSLACSTPKKVTPCGFHLEHVLMKALQF